MTEEEIKNLKTGDKITITLTAEETNDHMAFVDESGTPFILSTSNIHSATLVKPAPKFEVGDTVRIITDPLSGRIHGGHYSQQLIAREGVIESIADDDDENTMWLHIDGYDHRWGISPHCLELVKKAVKNKYTVRETDYEWRILHADDPCCFVSGWHKHNHPNAESAARAECDRLNAEWRKQQDPAAPN